MFKWVLTEFLCGREKLNSMNLLLYMAPMAVVFLLPATLIMEENVVGITLALARDDNKIIWYLLFNSALAYFVNLTNFLVTKHTSALTLQVSRINLIGFHSSLFFFYVLFTPTKCLLSHLLVVGTSDFGGCQMSLLSNHRICITLSALCWSLFLFCLSSSAMRSVAELFCLRMEFFENKLYQVM